MQANFTMPDGDGELHVQVEHVGVTTTGNTFKVEFTVAADCGESEIEVLRRVGKILAQHDYYGTR